MKTIAYILPAFDEEAGIENFHAVLSEAVKKIEAKYAFKFLYINDGSTDSTLSKLLSLAEKDKRVQIINFSKNYGHQIAITAGLDLVEGDAVIIMDVDLQDPPEVSLEMIKKWEEGYELIYGKRKERKDGFFKKLTAFLFYRILNKFIDSKIPEDTGDFRLIDKKVVHAIRKFREKNRYMRGLFTILGYRQFAVEYDRDKRFAGQTHYPLKKMIRLALDGILGFSLLPLKFITSFGFLVSSLSILGIFYALAMRIFFPQITVSGFTFIVISILFIGGVQMIMLGILGEYIGRIYNEVRNRPLYTISTLVNIDE